MDYPGALSSLSFCGFLEYLLILLVTGAFCFASSKHMQSDIAPTDLEAEKTSEIEQHPSEEFENSVESNVIACDFAMAMRPDAENIKDPISSSESTAVVDPKSSTPPHASKPAPRKSALRLSNIPTPLRGPINTMPDFDISLHSPSSQIIGTPFATNSTRFEYPFPEPNDSTSDSPPPAFISPELPPAAVALSSLPILFPPTTTTASVFPASAAAATAAAASSPQSYMSSPSASSSTFSLSHHQSSPPFALVSFTPSGSNPDLSATGLNGSPSTHTSPVHPKLKTFTNPPIPPGLISRRDRWNLNLKARRKGSGASLSGSSSVSDAGTNFGSAGSVLGSPEEEESPIGMGTRSPGS